MYIILKYRNFTIAAGVFLILYFFYLAQNLFFVNTLNDFDQFFVWAEAWTGGEFLWISSSEMLLTIIDYIAIIFAKNDFVSIYKLINFIIYTLLFISLIILVAKKNEVLPNFNVKLLFSIFLLLIPYFAVKSLTVDQSLLMTVFLIFFLSSYNNPYLGIVSLLFFMTRPESYMIFVLYPLLFFIDKKNRKKILINFVSFIVFVVAYKYFGKIINPKIDNAFSTGQAFAIITAENKYTLEFFINSIKGVLSIPAMFFTFGLEILQNWFAFFFFAIGAIFSIRNKKMYAFYGIVVAYCLLLFGLSSTGYGWFNFFSSLRIILPNIEFFNTNISIANGFETEFNYIAWSRYRLPLYPSIAIFTIAGIQIFINFIKTKVLAKNIQVVFENEFHKFQKKQDQKSKKANRSIAKRINLKKEFSVEFEKKVSKYAYLAVIAVFSFLLMNNIFSYKNFSKTYKYENQLVNTNDFFKAAMELRKFRSSPNDKVMLWDVCSSTQGASMAMFTVFSGIRFIYVPICNESNSPLVRNHPENKTASMTPQELSELNKYRIVYLDRYMIDYKTSFDSTQIAHAFDMYNLKSEAFDTLQVKYLVSSKEINAEDINLLKKTGSYYLYLYKKM